jgi:hypothetical protein
VADRTGQEAFLPVVAPASIEVGMADEYYPGIPSSSPSGSPATPTGSARRT